ncbi:hypothetical protein PR202_ga06471 [Eleusine coracana subsp. coracana]|uniref:Uncharacterized protein n=1 Tax=Eleusine coracana subsp. coracana TaxID=191504 RepID=A0AAV5BX91_ELECO|nr:hypothetical protein PR202_ga06471 [Eleusine coracana subsp. coracana]
MVMLSVKLLIPTSVNVQEIKQGYLAQKDALLVAKNLKLLIKGSPVSKLATPSASAIIPLHRNLKPTSVRPWTDSAKNRKRFGLPGLDEISVTASAS